MKLIEETNCSSCGKSFTLFDFLTIRDTCLSCVIDQDREEVLLNEAYEEHVHLIENADLQSFVVDKIKEVVDLLDKEAETK